jgi:phage host-nuclease inhibitor protein Gam
LADVTSKLLLAMNILTSTFPTSGHALFLYDVCLVTLNLLQLAYSLGPVLVRVFSFLSFDFPLVATADDNVKVFGRFVVPKTSARFTLTFMGFTFGTSDSRFGRLAFIVNLFTPDDLAYTQVLECIRLHNSDTELAKGRLAWSALRKETYKQAFESAVVKVLASYQVRKQLLDAAIKRHNIKQTEAALQEPAASTLCAELDELQKELQRVMARIGDMVTEFGKTCLGELKDGSSTQWAVFRESVDKLTGARTQAAALKDDPNRHLTVLTCVILSGCVFLVGWYLAANEPDFFNPSSPPPPPLYARPPPPRPAAG